jgi:hypothetical protein
MNEIELEEFFKKHSGHIAVNGFCLYWLKEEWLVVENGELFMNAIYNGDSFNDALKSIPLLVTQEQDEDDGVYAYNV